MFVYAKGLNTVTNQLFCFRLVYS